MAVQKQFDSSRAQIDPRLEGATLASFHKRAFAFAIDWGVILLATRYLWLTVLIAFAYKFYAKRKGHPVITHEDVKSRLLQISHKLGELGVEQKVLNSARQYTVWYIYIFMGILFVVSILMAVEILFGNFIPKDYQVILAGLKSELEVDPIGSVYKGFKLFGSTVLGVIYFAFITYKWQGQTIGKRIVGIYVAKLNGAPMTLRDSFERVSGYTASASLLFTGFFQYFWDVNHQTTHDKIVETIVIDASEYVPETEMEMAQQYENN